MTTDASRTGWGAVLKLGQSELLQASTWKKPMSLRSSNQREARAILYALRKFKLQLAGIDQLTVQTDNQVAVMNLQRKVSAAPLATTMRLIFQDAMQMGLMLHAVHIMGVDNRQADALNRLELVGDYQIRTKYPTTALLQLGLTLQEYMFATKKNAKCTIYYSLTQEEAAAGTVGIQDVWENKVILINPPLTLIGKVVQKLRTVLNCTAVVIAMDWPNQWWSQQLQNMASDQIILEEQESLIWEMGPILWRTRRDALSNQDVYLKSKNKNASSLLKGNVVQNFRTKDFTRSPLISTVMRQIVSGIVKKPRYCKAWNFSMLLDFEGLKSNEKTQQSVILHVLILLEAYFTLRGSQLALITKKQITMDTDQIKTIDSKRNANNGCKEIKIRPRFNKTICPQVALSKRIEMLNNRFPNQNSVRLNKMKHLCIRFRRQRFDQNKNQVSRNKQRIWVQYNKTFSKDSIQKIQSFTEISQQAYRSRPGFHSSR
ncbi:MAG: hypothetical protein EZS28_003798 [Streblomastix strix]|uniref:Reverse transcriptase RNase H-like domain-containing protein n=1 Tax=Streblomastix strix TaxID=222440 RepID=A0A5J4X0G2_9EUKA|nr:MAG: hypothetical protein EZS28_003798 [Streblomastix strix]